MTPATQLPDAFTGPAAMLMSVLTATVAVLLTAANVLLTVMRKYDANRYNMAQLRPDLPMLAVEGSGRFKALGLVRTPLKPLELQQHSGGPGSRGPQQPERLTEPSAAAEAVNFVFSSTCSSSSSNTMSAVLLSAVTSATPVPAVVWQLQAQQV